VQHQLPEFQYACGKFDAHVTQVNTESLFKLYDSVLTNNSVRVEEFEFTKMA
jgi:hypothetical protein